MTMTINASAPRLVSLFSGCGGMDKGFEQAGFHRVWANDFDKDAQAVFQLNFGEIDGRDIRDVPVDEIPSCDILTAVVSMIPVESFIWNVCASLKKRCRALLYLKTSRDWFLPGIRMEKN